MEIDVTSVSTVVLHAHLKRISDYMICGENVWWHMKDNMLVFHDGDDEPNCRVEGPVMKEFTTETMATISLHLDKCWENCINDDSIIILLKQVNIQIWFIILCILFQFHSNNYFNFMKNNFHN